MPAADAPADLDLLAGAAREAADLALGYFGRHPKVWQKANASPVSEADLAVDALLKARLTAARPDYGWLSEETTDDRRRLGTRRVFVVDPIDGTRGFLAATEEWTVSLAVVEDGRPMVAALVQPVTGRLHLARAGAGATLDGHALAVRPRATGAVLPAAGPAALLARLRTPLPTIAEAGYVASLALRIAMVADGRLALALAKPDASDWDIAAADLILSEAGGRLVDFAGDAIVYNRPDTRHGGLAGAAPGLLPEVLALLGRKADPASPRKPG